MGILLVLHLSIPEELEKFPDYDTACKQTTAWMYHHDRLSTREAGWSEYRDQFAVWKRQTMEIRSFWNLLADTHIAYRQSKEKGQQMLRLFKQACEEMGGPGAYERGWTPIALPADYWPRPSNYSPTPNSEERAQ